MAEVASAYVSLIPSFQGGGRTIKKELEGLGDEAGDSAGRKSGEKFTGAFSGAMKSLAAPVAAAFAAVGVGQFLGSAIEQASDLNEAGTKLGVVFGDAVGQVNEFASKGAKALGQSNLDVLNAAASFGVYGKAAGLSDTANAEFSNSLVQLSTDLASFYNTDPGEAMEALGAGLRGESEPLRAYGVLLDDATLRQKALELGLISTTKNALTPQQRVLAAQASIMEQTSLAQGDFARTSGGLANQQRILAAQFSDLKTNLGTALLPLILGFVTALNSAVGPVAALAGPALSQLNLGISAAAAAFREGDVTSDGFVGAMERAGNAVRGLFELVKTGNFTAFLRQGLGVEEDSGIASGLLGIRQTAVDTFAAIGAALQPAKEAFAELGPTLAALAPQVLTVATSFSPLGLALQALAPVLPTIAGALGQVAAALVGALVSALPSVLQLVSALGGALAQALAALAPSVTTVATALGPALATSVGALAPVLTTVVTALAALLTAASPLAPAILGIVAAVAISRAAMGAYAAVTGTVAAAKQAYAFATYGQATAEGGLLVRLAATTGALQVRAAAMIASTRATLTNIATNVKWQVLLAQQSAKSAAQSVLTWIAASARVTAAWVAAQARIVATYVATAAAAVANAARTAAAWVAAQARIAASYVATAASAVAQAAIASAAWVASAARTAAGVAVQTAAFVATRAAMLAGAAASGIATAAQWALNAALNANPIGLVVIAIAALVAGFVLAYKNSETFRNIVNAAWEALKTGFGNAIAFVTGTAIPALLSGWELVKSATKAAWDFVVNLVKSAVAGVVTLFLNFTVPGLIIKHWDSIKAATASAWDAVKNYVANAVAGIIAIGSKIAAFVSGVVGYFVDLNQRAAAALSALATAVVGKIVEAFNAAKAKAAEFLQIGTFIIEGLIKGLSAGLAKVKAKAGEIAQGALDAAKAKLGIRSPSRAFIEVGEFVNQGLVIGLTSTAKDVESATGKIADNVYKGFKEIVSNQIDAGVAEIDKSVDGLKRQAEALSKTADARKKNAAQIERLNAQIKDLGVRRNALNDSVESTVVAKSESLLRSISSQTDALSLIAVQRDNVAGQIKEASKSLEDAVKLRDDFLASVSASAQQVGSLASLFQGASQDKTPFSLSTLIEGMTSASTATDSFRQKLEKLAAGGLTDDLYKQIADAGVEVGSQIADSILNGGPDAIAQLNDLSEKLSNNADYLGEQVSAHLYQAGVDSAQGLFDGLASKEDELFLKAQQIADGIAERIRKALDIHSPSRVMASIGEQIGAGLAQGIEDSAGLVSRATDDLFTVPSVPAARVPAAVRTPAGVGAGALYGQGGPLVANYVTVEQEVDWEVLQRRQQFQVASLVPA